MKYKGRYSYKEIKVLDLIYTYGDNDGDHHKQWVLDQTVRILTGKNYNDWVRIRKKGEDGPNNYRWEV